MPPVLVLRAGRPRRLPPGWELVTEDGARLHRLPADLAPGYHRLLRHSDGAGALVVLSPGACHLPADLRGWGFAVQLYALRSQKSWGLGDLADLRRLATWSRGRGAAFLMTSPLGAALPTLPQEPSPYYASSRIWLNPLHLRLEEVPGAERLGADLERLAKLSRALNRDRHLDRDQVYRLKLEALESLYGRGDPPAEFERWRAAQGRLLELFATFCVLAERHQTGWHGWPEEHQHPDRPQVARLAARLRARTRFHAWVQWQLDRQLERAGRALPLLNDLPVGVRPDGADAWVWQDV
ncbi:MAG TPA: 4-alpha-glucanotransferase, partial [Candidatus Acidoferrales bacterium]|nr:4-alpha-glucanotransferase [Candidatus Acidoferrales bacterium]